MIYRDLVADLTGVARYGAGTLTRPNNATPYTAEDAVGGTSAILTLTGFGSAGEIIEISTVTLKIAETSVPGGMAGFKLRFYSGSPTAIADNAAWSIGADSALYLGHVALSTPVDVGSVLFSNNDSLRHYIKMTGSDLYAILTTDAGYTPTALTAYDFVIVGQVR